MLKNNNNFEYLYITKSINDTLIRKFEDKIFLILDKLSQKYLLKI